MVVGEIMWGGMDWIDLAQDRSKCRALVNVVINHWVASNAGELLNVYTTGGHSSSAQLHRVIGQSCPNLSKTKQKLRGP
jgi:hypothetical protein